MTNPTDTAFTPNVRAEQARRGSANAYANRRMEERLSPDVRAFVESRDSAYLATSDPGGQPYVQHRGGPPGFLRVMGERTIAFADYRGNRQYISTANLRSNPKAFLFLMDYATRTRLKFWGRASVSDDPDILKALSSEGYKAKTEQAIFFEVIVWDANCTQHIPQKIDASAVQAALSDRDDKIADLKLRLDAC